MSGRYGYKNFKETPTRKVIATSLRIVALPFNIVQAALNVAADAVVDRRRHVYTDRSV